MKVNRFVITFIVWSCSLACINRNPAAIEDNNSATDSAVAVNIAAADSFEAGKVIRNVTCKTDATQSYALYIPFKGNREALPVIYFFDPHADGSFPLNEYRS